VDPAASIRKLGFRKWYERQLIDSHVALVACLVSGITIAAAVEEINFAEFGNAVVLLGVVAAAILIGWHSWHRYIRVLQRAERYGEHSTCTRCEAYGRFEVLASGTDREAPEGAPLQGSWLRVKCRKCANTWLIA
jgi:hypothetical protein